MPERITFQLRLAYIKVIAIVVVVALIPAILMTWVQGKTTDQRLRRGQVQSCQRSLLDRRVNLQGWETAAQARREAARSATSAKEKQLNQVAEQRYEQIVKSLKSRAYLVCEKVIPKP